MKGRFVAITDTHYTLSSSVRTGSYLDDLIEKTDWVVSLANSLDATIIHSGDFFDKPTVPDEVKSRVVESYRRCKHTPKVIVGNHDRLYGSDEYNHRTSLYLLAQTGVIDMNFPQVYDDCVLCSERPLLNHPSGLPLINLWHGFLNHEDGLSTFNLEDIVSDTPNLLLLGHDHVPYAPVQYKKTEVYRAGSFVRAIRNDSSDRTPEVLIIEIVDGVPVVTPKPIEVAKEVELLFKHKVATQEKTSISSYSDIVALLTLDKENLTLFKALEQVTDMDTINFIKEKLNQ